VDRTYRHLLLLQGVLAAGNSMAVVFAITYFRNVGFSDGDVVLLNLVAFAVAALACVAFTRVRALPARASMAAGLVVLAASYGAYLVLSGWPLLVFVAVAWGAYIPLFFLPFNALVIGQTQAGDRARKVATFILAYTVVGIAGPALGGAVVDRLGYGPLFALSVGILGGGIALLFLLGVGDRTVGFAFDFRRMGARTNVALFAEGGFEGMAFGILPLIAYGFTSEAIDLGGLFSLFALAGGAVTVILGVASDRLRNRRPFLLAGAACSVVASLLVVQSRSLAAFAVGNSLLSLTSSLAPVFLFTIAVERGPGRHAEAIVTREVLLNAGRAASLSAFFVLIMLGATTQQAFALAAVSLAFVALGDARRAVE
jgi:predicted MFS family arabinose efflux permease